jgi:hypothetical protein
VEDDESVKKTVGDQESWRECCGGGREPSAFSSVEDEEAWRRVLRKLSSLRVTGKEAGCSIAAQSKRVATKT